MLCNPRYPLILGLLALLTLVDAQNGAPFEDGVSYKGRPAREFCLGTDNGMNIINVGQNMSHYERLLNSFVRCTRIIGNLEITHIRPEDLENDYDTWQGPSGEIQRRKRKPFWFLKDLEEVTGYILLFNVYLERIDFPKLKIIWGGKLHKGYALEINACGPLGVLNFPALRSIENGLIKISSSPHLCFFQQNVDFYELLGSNYKSKLHVIGQPMCRERASCNPSCKDGSCFGPLTTDCQVVYRRNCAKCSSGMCYADERGSTHCCDDACTGGCYGDGEDKCVACKHYEQDGRCVTSCRGNSDYNSTAMIRRPIQKTQKRYYYGKLCIEECPSNTLIEEDRFCVARCSPGSYRNHLVDERRCIPCNGECPKVCEVNGRIDSTTIKNLVNCTEIDGNIELLNHVFDPHSPEIFDPSNPLFLIPALTEKDLEVLRTVKIVTGYVSVDGGSKDLPGRPRSMDFLENLEIIEGRNLFFDKFSLNVIGNYHMTSLGLKSLRKIRSGAISFKNNSNLCYGRGIPFREKYKVDVAIWMNNMHGRECDRMGRVCDNTCHPLMGCWGAGPAQCLLCRHFEKDGICSNTCPTHDGYYIPPNQPPINDRHVTNAQNRRCEACAEECKECWGPGADQCRTCRYLEFWSEDRKSMRCVRDCPRNTYPHGNQCIRCQPACLLYQGEKMGCTGNGTHFGPGGCNSCLYAVERRKDQIECLVGSSDETVCEDNNLHNYHAGFATIGNRNELKFMCHKCPAECSSCYKSSTDPRYCTCAAYMLQSNSLVKFLNTSWELTRKSERSSSSEQEGTEILSDYDEELDSYEKSCVLECGKGTFELLPRTQNSSGICEKCHPLCDSEYTCTGPAATQCLRCRVGGLERDSGEVECINKCPDDRPFSFEGGVCSDENIEASMARRRNIFIFIGIMIFILVAFLIFYLIYRCMNYRKKYEKEAKMHLPEIPALDPRKLTHRANMRRLNLISVDELDNTGAKQSRILGQGAFGIVYAGKWKPPGRNCSIPVAIKAINPNETKNVTEAEMMKEAGIMATVEHEHLLPLVGVCVAKGGLKIVTILRPLGSLLKFLGEHKQHLSAKQMVLYCFQISSGMEFLARKKIIHRDLAARNVLVRNINHVEITDFGLAQMLQGNDSMVVMEGRVAVKWLAIESLLDQIYTERTDVWAFGVTCWEILTYGEAPYKELSSVLPKNQNFARELANMLEKGHRLRQPNNCSQDLYQELLNCWLVDPESRPTFRKLKERFNTFCQAPHIYIQDRQAAQQMDSISDSEQRAMIEKLLQDSDFIDPLQLDPTDYNNTITSGTMSTQPGRINTIRPSNTTVETFLPDTPTTASFNGNPLCRSQCNSNSSARYKNQPLIEALGMDEENYLMPRPAASKEDEPSLVYTPVLATDQNGAPLQDSPTHEYCNDPKHKLLDSEQKNSSQNYVNQQIETAF